MTAIIGINAYHGDSSACLVVDGQLVVAVEEERFRRIKHWAGFPSESIAYCLKANRMCLSDIDYVAINQDAKANLGRKLAYMIKHRPSIGMLLDRVRNKRERVGIAEELTNAFPGVALQAEVRFVEHHMSHMASAFLVSPFDDASVVSVDGFGDFASAAWGLGNGNRIDIEGKVYFPHSLGIFYQGLTQYLGFPHYGDEYKVMGLAPYGKPVYLDKMRNIVRLKDDGSFELDLKFFRHHKESVAYEWENGEPKVGVLYTPELEALLGPTREKSEELTKRHMDLARSIQAMYEEAFFNLLNSLYVRHETDALTLAGGCAMNSVANGRVYDNTPFRNMYIQSAAGDAGGAIGAAYYVATELGDSNRDFHMDHAYWGTEYGNEDIGTLLKEKEQSLSEANCVVRRVESEDELVKVTAAAIVKGCVVGWFQGRMEWGPRALGNRSILGDPRRKDMKDILNLKIKRRESFRPFAPSILRERVSEWFERDDDVAFMMKVFQIREEKREQIPAVTHVDGSGRLQTVYSDSNPRYYSLIREFEEQTGVPILLNTSFNENEPVVCSPREALDCFLRTKMDVLALGDWYVERRE